MKTLYHYSPPNSFQSMKNVFLLTTIMSSFLSIYFAFYFTIELLFSIAVSIITFILVLIYKFKYEKYANKWIYGEILLCVIMTILILHLPSYYLSSSRITYKMKPKDEFIVKFDSYLLDWAFKHGQISLYLDNNNYIGPHTPVGQLINNILQIFYLFYYIIPYTTLYAIFEANCIKEIIYRYINKGQISYTYNSHWKNTFFIFGIYNLTYIIVFIINSCIPAGSPRKYFQKEFKHQLKLLGFSKFLNNTLKDDKSANSFPSGHVAETMCIAFAYFGMGKKFEGIFFFLSSLMIIFATLFLRYHYFVDVLCALSIAGFCFYFNYYFGYIRDEGIIYKKNKNGAVFMINENANISNNLNNLNA